MALNKQTRGARASVVGEPRGGGAGAGDARARRDDLRNSTIVSPMDGLVLSRDVEVGDAVSSILVLGSQATLVMTLGDVSERLRARQGRRGRHRQGLPGPAARIVVESFKDKKFEGEVTKISPLGVEKDNVTTFEVRVSILNPGGELKANMTANAEIILRGEEGRPAGARDRGASTTRTRKPSSRCPTRRQKNGKRKVAVKLGISNGVKTELVEPGSRKASRIVLQ